MGSVDFSTSPSVDRLKFEEFPNGDLVGLIGALDVTGWFIKTLSGY